MDADTHQMIPFSVFMDRALYDPDTGFYANGGMAGRRGDFLTSPEVGPLFGAVVARALDSWWDALGQPVPYIVAEAGAGPGTLARTIRVAEPRCAPALQYSMVERSARQRRTQPTGQTLASVGDLTALTARPHVILANELLDNLPFDLLVFDQGWRQAWVDSGDTGAQEILRTLSEAPTLTSLPAKAQLGARVPLQRAAATWVADAVAMLQPGGVLVVFDYCSTTHAMAQRPWREWLRTYRAHERGVHYLKAVGEQDITADVAVDQLPPPDAVRSQTQWLLLHGIEDLVAEGRDLWAERGHIADIAALRARSRIREAEALTDASGLGAFLVLEWSAPV